MGNAQCIKVIGQFSKAVFTFSLKPFLLSNIGQSPLSKSFFSSYPYENVIIFPSNVNVYNISFSTLTSLAIFRVYMYISSQIV
jgi:hypothetical protein